MFTNPMDRGKRNIPRGQAINMGQEVKDMSDGFDCALALLPESIRAAAERAALPRERTEEFRLRVSRPPTALIGERETPLRSVPVTAEELQCVLDAATQCSFHAAADELRRGFISARGGVRVGVCGTAVTDGAVRVLREISSVSIRIPRQIRTAGAGIMESLKCASVLILSPPGAGKTTFLREIVRVTSDAGERVGLADERGEIAAVWRGAPQFDVGAHTDVLSGAPKAEAALMLLRAMNPRVIALDEISAPEDVSAVLRVAGCGVRVFATAHAASVEALRARRMYREVLEAGIFDKAVLIASGRERTYRVAAL